jgi:hypothetical protein
MFSVEGGNCTVNMVNGAHCFDSPNYPAAYGNAQSCTVRVHADIALNLLEFDTEGEGDSMQVSTPFCSTR